MVKEMKRILLASPHLFGNERKYVEDAIESNWIAPLGAYVNRLESDIKEKVGCKAAIALSSGTAAIHLALIEAGVGKDDIVFCSDLTFAASANPIVYCGAKPVFIDCDDESFNMSPVALERAFQKHHAKAVVVASIYGQPARLDEIAAVCKKHDSVMIEDATEVLGATYKNKYAGTYGDFGTYSFNGNKIITTSGGGMLVSNNEKKISHALYLATQAKEKSRYYEHSEIGYNYRLSNISAAIGVGQLECLEEKVQIKKAIFDRYNEALKEFANYGVKMLEVPSNRTSNYWLSILVIEDISFIKPEDLVDILADESIEARHVWKPLHTQKCYGCTELVTEEEKETNPNSDYLFKHGVCLPSDENMTIEEQNRVISVIRTFVRNSICTKKKLDLMFKGDEDVESALRVLQ